MLELSSGEAVKDKEMSGSDERRRGEGTDRRGRVEEREDEEEDIVGRWW